MNITQTNRNKLFYNKFCYRVILKYLGVRFVSNTRDLDHFKRKINKARKNNSSVWYKLPVPKLTELNLDLCEKLIVFYNNYSCNKEVTFLHEHLSLSLYTSNIDILKELYQIDNNIEITQALTPPSAIMYFAKEPEYKYRVYFKSTRASSELLSTLNSFRYSYHDKGDVWLSGGLVLFLMRHCNTHKSFYLPSSSFIDFKDEQTLTLMHLLFGECLRKSYKLEKRPE